MKNSPQPKIAQSVTDNRLAPVEMADSFSPITHPKMTPIGAKDVFMQYRKNLSPREYSQ